MKNILIYLALAVILIVSGCEKDKKDDPLPTHGFRLIEIGYSGENVIDDDIIFTYENDKVTGWTDKDFDNRDFEVEITYPTDNTVEFVIIDVMDSIVEPDLKMIYTFDNDHITMVQGYYFAGTQFVADYKTQYTYNADGNILNVIYYEIEEGIEEPSNKYVYSYNGDLLIENINSQYTGVSWEASIKNTYQYTDNLLSTTTTSYSYNNIWSEVNKDEFIYNGAEVVQIKTYTSTYDSLWLETSTVDYSYDTDGNMIAATEASTSGETYTESYIYEAKQGNLSVFDFNEEYGHPNPIYNPQLPTSLIHRPER